MKSLNQLHLIGLVGNDPKIYAMPSGAMIARLSIATDEIYRNKEKREVRKITEWHSVLFHGMLAELVIRFVQKGSSVYIRGAIRHREYVDNEQNHKTITEVLGQELIVLTGGKFVKATDPQADINNDEDKKPQYLM